MFKQGDFVMDNAGNVAVIISINKSSFHYKWRLIRGNDVGDHGVTASCSNEWIHMFTKIDPVIFDLMKGINNAN